MAVKFRRTFPRSSPAATDELLGDIRELLFLQLHALIAAPDPGGELTPTRKRLERFIAERMEDEA